MNAPRPIRLGMVGGGEGAFIGAVHRLAARMDGAFELVAGALSATPAKARLSARTLGLARGYADFREMARAEAARPDGIEAVAIVTPNHLHAPAARAFLAKGIHTICDKPLTATLSQARALAAAARASHAIFALTHNYTGYPLVRHARAMVEAGELGKLRIVRVSYAQDWLATRLEATGQKQAQWRTDPERAGPGGALGDIGTHAFNLVTYVSGLEVEALAADISSFVPGRRVDDDARILLRLSHGARGMLWASQVATGHENDLVLYLHGTKGGFVWRQEDPNRLIFTPLGEAPRTITRGSASVSRAAARVTRVPAGHPEGYLEAFANLYAEIARAIRARQGGKRIPRDVEFPGLADGLAGMRFVSTAIASARAGGRWRRLAELA
jgi:predicted dehydrogenase